MIKNWILNSYIINFTAEILDSFKLDFGFKKIGRI